MKKIAGLVCCVVLRENSIIHVSETRKGEEKKEGKGVEDSGNHGGNDFGMVSRKSGWSVRMRNVRYGYQSMRVPEGWKGGEGVFKCGMRVMKEVVEVKCENEKLKRENENLKREVEVMKNEDAKRKGAGVHERNDNVKTWATIAKRISDERIIEKLERVETGMIVKKRDIRKEVKKSNIEERRKRRMFVFI